MGSDVKIELNHKKIQELSFTLDNLEIEIAKEYLDDVQAADVIPVLSGALYKSLKVEKTGDSATIKSDLPYSELRYHVNPKNPDKTLWFERVDSEKAVKRVIERHRRDLE